MHVTPKSHLFIFTLFGGLLLSVASVCFWFLLFKAQDNLVLKALQARQNFIALSYKMLAVSQQPKRVYFKQIQLLKDKYTPDDLRHIFMMNDEDLALYQVFNKSIALIFSQQEIMIALPATQKKISTECQGLAVMLQGLSARLTKTGAYSIETIRQIDHLITQLQMIETQLAYLSDINQLDNAFTVAALTNILLDIEISFRDLLKGVATQGIQSLQGSADEEVIFEGQSIYGKIALAVAELLVLSPEFIETKQKVANLAEISLKLLNQFDAFIETQRTSDAKKRDTMLLVNLLFFLILLIVLVFIYIFYCFSAHKTDL